MPQRIEISGRPAQGYFLQPVANVSGTGANHLHGNSDGDKYPCCPGCDGNLRALLRLRCSDRRLDIEMFPVDRLPLLVCPRHVSRALVYSLTSAGELLVEDRHDGRRLENFAPLNIKVPDSQEMLLHAIPDRISRTRELASEGRLPEAPDWAGKFEWGHPQNQIGGVPVLVNRELESPVCSLCGSGMPFFASVVVDVGSPLDSGTMSLQLLYFLCRGCLNVTLIPDISEARHS